MSRCRSCEAPITWAETESGKAMPLDAKPTRDGNMVLVRGKTRFANEEDRRLARPLYMSHFATCPDASAHRKPKGYRT